MLRDGYVGSISEPQKEQLCLMLDSIEHMRQLISTLLNVARIEDSGIEAWAHTSRLEKLTAEVIKELASQAHMKQIAVRLKALGNSHGIRTNAILVKETLTNIIANAIKYTPPEGTIAISFRTTPKDIIIMVKDNGYGIPLAEHNHIFTKFYRASNITDRETTGTGLGLYIAKEIVDILGGEIWFDSKPNKGTTFFVSLPKTGSATKGGTTQRKPAIATPHIKPYNKSSKKHQ